MEKRQVRLARAVLRGLPVICMVSSTFAAVVLPASAAVSAQSRYPAQAGVCRNKYSGPNCGGGSTTTSKPTTSTTACDPNLLQDAEREFATASSFIDAGVKELNQAADSITDFEKDYIKEAAEVSAEKLTLLNILHSVSESATEIAEVTGLYVGIGVLAEQLAFDVYPLINDASQLSQEARDDFTRGQQWAERAEADLQKALAQGPCLGPLEKQLDALLKQQSLDEQAHALIDSWENNGAVYVDPVSNDVLNEAAALKTAKAMLLAAAPSSGGAQVEILLAAPTMPSKAQLQAALTLVTDAQGDQTYATGKLTLLVTATDKLLTSLDKLF